MWLIGMSGDMCTHVSHDVTRVPTNGVTCHMSLMGSAPPSCTSHNFITELWYIAPSIHHCDVQSHTPPVTAVTPPATRAAHTRSGPYTAAAAPSHHRVTTAAKHHHTPDHARPATNSTSNAAAYTKHHITVIKPYTTSQYTT